MTPTLRSGGTRVAALALAAALVGACASPTPHARVRRAIVGGTEAPVGAYPETVALMDLAAGDPTSYFCSGTLIAPDQVISAAHCLFDWHDRRVPDTDVGVFFGHDAQSVPLAQVKRVKKTFVPDTYPYGEITDDYYGLGRDDDISLLVLEEPITGVEPAPIFPADRLAELTQGTMLLMVGFGATSLDGSGPDGVMFYASSPVQVHSSYEIAIGAPGQPDTCFGDSGGPAFKEEAGTRLLVGITSRGTYTATIDCGEGTVNTIAPAYLDWIADSLASMDGGTPQQDAGQHDAASPQDAGRADAGRDGSSDQPDGGGGHASKGCSAAAASTAGQHPSSSALLFVTAGLLFVRRRPR